MLLERPPKLEQVLPGNKDLCFGTGSSFDVHFVLDIIDGLK